MKIAIGADHAGYQLKEDIVQYMRELGYDVEDFGTHSPDPVDYPNIALKVARSVAHGEFDRGILLCGTGAGVCMTANKVKRIRAASCSDTFTAHAVRAHNDANILCLGGRVLGTGLARDIVKIWIETPFSQGERHVRRIGEMTAIDDAR
jgi:ribose 5-phosphate isomerase B